MIAWLKKHHILHTFGKWEQEWDKAYAFQKRQCERCGKVQKEWL